VGLLSAPAPPRLQVAPSPSIRTTPNIAFQRTRVARFARSGSPLNAVTLGAAAKSCAGPRTLQSEPRLRSNASRCSASIAASQGATARPAAVAIPGRAAHQPWSAVLLLPAPPSPSASSRPAQNRACTGVNLERKCCA
jgi:hypothetical protein